MRLKSSVRLSGLRPECVVAMLVMNSLYEKYGIQPGSFTITSVNDSTHRPNSLHYKGAAFDCRIWGIPATKLGSIIREAREMLDEFDIILEKDHIHVEYDPKPPLKAEKEKIT